MRKFSAFVGSGLIQVVLFASCQLTAPLQDIKRCSLQGRVISLGRIPSLVLRGGNDCYARNDDVLTSALGSVLEEHPRLAKSFSHLEDALRRFYEPSVSNDHWSIAEEEYANELTKLKDSRGRFKNVVNVSCHQIQTSSSNKTWVSDLLTLEKNEDLRFNQTLSLHKFSLSVARSMRNSGSIGVLLTEPYYKTSSQLNIALDTTKSAIRGTIAQMKDANGIVEVEQDDENHPNFEDMPQLDAAVHKLMDKQALPHAEDSPSNRATRAAAASESAGRRATADMRRANATALREGPQPPQGVAGEWQDALEEALVESDDSVGDNLYARTGEALASKFRDRQSERGGTGLEAAAAGEEDDGVAAEDVLAMLEVVRHKHNLLKEKDGGKVSKEVGDKITWVRGVLQEGSLPDVPGPKRRHRRRGSAGGDDTSQESEELW